MSIQNLVMFCPFILKISSKNQSLTSIKGHYSVVNLRKTKIYITDVDFVSDNVNTKFGLILPMPSQDMEQKPNSDQNQKPNQGPKLCFKFAKNNDLQHQR